MATISRKMGHSRAYAEGLLWEPPPVHVDRSGYTSKITPEPRRIGSTCPDRLEAQPRRHQQEGATEEQQPAEEPGYGSPFSFS